MRIPDTPLFVKTHDFLVWLLRHTQRFPKNLRQSYTLKLETTAFELQEALIMANAARSAARVHWQEIADGKLACLQALLRIAGDFQLLGGTQIHYAARMIDELGRLLGAWRKGTDRSPSVRGE